METRIENMLEMQEQNVRSAYQYASCGLSRIEKLIKQNKVSKQAVNNFLGASTTIIDIPMDSEFIYNRYSTYGVAVTRDVNSYVWSFNFSAGNVTHRKTGNCYPIKKWFRDFGFMINPEYKAEILALIGKTRTLVISTDTWFMLGCSVTAGGNQLDCSCHYPKCDGDYSAGATSYAIDRQTIGAFIWDCNGIIGRGLLYLDITHDGFVTGRRYGDFQESDFTHVRQFLYSKFGTTFRKSTNDSAYCLDTCGYTGYIDDGYFITYRLNHDVRVHVEFSEPMCPDCGTTHSDGSTICCDCSGNNYRCTYCGEGIRPDDTYYNEDGYPYCEYHFQQFYTTCSACDRVLSRSSSYVEFEGFDYCSRCADIRNIGECDSCGEISDSLSLNSENEIVCPDCMIVAP